MIISILFNYFIFFKLKNNKENNKLAPEEELCSPNSFPFSFP